MGIALDPEGVIAPVRTLDAVRKRRHMEVIFHVDSERIPDHY
jgi:hypothetical protein